MLTGSMVALATPMRTNGDIDNAQLRALVDFHIEAGTDAIVAVGTTGESATLNVKEHCDVIREVVQHVAGRVPVIAGTGANSTSEAIALTRSAKEAGADMALLVTPYYNRPTQEGLYLHYKAVAEAVDLPQILYNVPSRTACDLLPETAARLSSISNVIGIKEATGDLSRVAILRDLCGADFALYTGDDSTTVDFILQGGHGAISVTANVAPEKMHNMCVAALAGDEKLARAIDDDLALLHKNLFVEANPIPVKWALSEMGLISDGIRLPMTVLSIEYQSIVREALVAAGALT